MNYQLFNKKTLFRTLLFVSILFLSGSRLSFAATGCGTVGDVSDPDAAVDELRKVACVTGKGLDVAVLSSGAVFVGIMFVGSIKMSLSFGDAKGLQGAKATLTWGFIGFCCVAGVYTIYRIILNIVGANTTAFGLEAAIGGLIDWVKCAGRGGAC